MQAKEQLGQLEQGVPLHLSRLVAGQPCAEQLRARGLIRARHEPTDEEVRAEGARRLPGGRGGVDGGRLTPGWSGHREGEPGQERDGLTQDLHPNEGTNLPLPRPDAPCLHMLQEG